MLDSEASAKTYHQLTNRTKEQRRADRAIRNMMAVRKVFLQYKKYLTEKQIQGIRFALLEVLKVIEENPKLINIETRPPATALPGD